jgi:hypothetical protein
MVGESGSHCTLWPDLIRMSALSLTDPVTIQYSGKMNSSARMISRIRQSVS